MLMLSGPRGAIQLCSMSQATETRAKQVSSIINVADSSHFEPTTLSLHSNGLKSTQVEPTSPPQGILINVKSLLLIVIMSITIAMLSMLPVIHNKDYIIMRIQQT